MFLRDFRPVSFEANGKPLVVTQEGIQMYNGVQAKNPIYESGTDRVANGHIIVSGNLATQDRMEKYVDEVRNNSTAHDSNGIDVGTELYMIMEFSTAQVVAGLSYLCDEFNDLVGRFEYSIDGVEWTILANSLNFPDNVEKKSYVFQNDFPAKYYKLVISNPETSSGAYKGQLANINFVLDDIPITSAVEGVSNAFQKDDPDFDKISNYLGMYYQSLNDLFDKYKEIDELLGRLVEDDLTLTDDEISMVDVLDQQLGLIVSTDNIFVDYINIELGKK